MANDEKTKQEVAQEEINKFNEQIKSLMEKRKSLEQKYTFRGLYKRFSYRDNPLKVINQKDLTDSEKLKEGIEVIKQILAEYA